MREFKFRAWDKDCNKFIEDYGNTTYLESFGWDNEWYVVNQFSGQKDCNDKEMYESDIIKFHCNYADRKKVGYRIGVLTWNETYLRFELIVPGFDEPFDIKEETDEWYSKREILGNIYENPQLLTNE